MTFQDLYLRFCNAVAFIEVEDLNGTIGIGTAFHVGDGIFITARHVVDNKKIISIGTTTSGYHPDSSGNRIYEGINHKEYFPQELHLVSGPHFHPVIDVDVAAIVVRETDLPAIPLNTQINEYFADDEFVLSPVLVMGYPPIPFSSEPRLVAVRGDVSSVVDKYTGGAPYFIISAMARGGFSGAPCLDDEGTTFGLVTESLTINDQPSELGFMAVLTVRTIYACLVHHKLIPKQQEKNFEEVFVFWKDPRENT